MSLLRVLALSFVASSLLAGCSAFPGVHFNGAIPKRAEGSSTAPGEANYIVEPITPQLLRSQASASARQPTDAPNPALAQAITSYNYKAGPHDVLSVVIWGDTTQTSLFKPIGSTAYSSISPALGISAASTTSSDSNSTVGFKINADGSLYFPYVGRVMVAGLTTQEIQAELTTGLKPYIRDPQITVDIAQFNSQKFELAGAVVKPGLYPITDTPLTVSQAIAAAGGVINQVPNTITNGNTIPRALGDLSHVLYLHDGKPSVLNLRALYRDGDASQDRVVHPGDSILVPDNSQEQIHVIGEVPNPGNYPLNDGSLNLSQLLGEAGQLNLITANSSRIFVFRGAYQKPQVFWLDLASPDALLLANKFELEPQDVVYVAATKLTDWSRVISQILPTVQTLYETKVLVTR